MLRMVFWLPSLQNVTPGNFLRVVSTCQGWAFRSPTCRSLGNSPQHQGPQIPFLISPCSSPQIPKLTLPC